MLAQAFFISPHDLWTMIGSASAPQIVDVCRRDVYESVSGVVPASTWRGPGPASQWQQTLDRQRPVVVTCKAGTI